MKKRSAKRRTSTEELVPIEEFKPEPRRGARRVYGALRDREDAKVGIRERIKRSLGLEE